MTGSVSCRLVPKKKSSLQQGHQAVGSRESACKGYGVVCGNTLRSQLIFQGMYSDRKTCKMRIVTACRACEYTMILYFSSFRPRDVRGERCCYVPTGDVSTRNTNLLEVTTSRLMPLPRAEKLARVRFLLNIYLHQGTLCGDTVLGVEMGCILCPNIGNMSLVLGPLTPVF